jgi:hypothetical protein
MAASGIETYRVSEESEENVSENQASVAKAASGGGIGGAYRKKNWRRMAAAYGGCERGEEGGECGAAIDDDNISVINVVKQSDREA